MVKPPPSDISTIGIQAVRQFRRVRLPDKGPIFEPPSSGPCIFESAYAISADGEGG